MVIRFGRYPVSKSATALLERVRPVSLAVDVAETRDFNAATDVFVGTTPLGFVRSGWRAEGRKHVHASMISGSHGMRIYSLDHGFSTTEITLVAGENVEARNRGVIEITTPERPTPILVPLMILG